MKGAGQYQCRKHKAGGLNSGGEEFNGHHALSAGQSGSDGSLMYRSMTEALWAGLTVDDLPACLCLSTFRATILSTRFRARDWRAGRADF